MIYGIGCDIIKISRIERLLEKNGEKFLNRVYSEEELGSAPVEPTQYSAYLAKRFAAKEAFAKALGTGIGEEIAFNRISILNDQKGRPYIKTDEKYSKLKIHLSISDERTYAIAYVVLEKD
jgi:holo-[acyl-carrier protein] synthase